MHYRESYFARIFYTKLPEILRIVTDVRLKLAAGTPVIPIQAGDRSPPADVQPELGA